MKITCNIIFNNNPNKVFYPGQNVIGQIELKFPEPIKVKGISYIFGGKAQTKFSIKRGKTRTYYTGKEPYFEQQVHLVSNGRDEQLVEAGTYNYPFCQEFPSDVPSSIEASSGRHCHARYSIKVVIDKPYWFNTEFTEYFTHIRPLDLNIFPLFHGPIVKNDSKTYYWGGFCVPFESEPIHVSVRLPSGGYAPGQQIDVTVNVDNKSNVNPAFDVNLVQHFNLKTEDLGLIGIKEKEKEFFIVENRNVYTSRAGSKNEFESSLVIPPLPPTDQQNSKIFQMKYYVSVS